MKTAIAAIALIVAPLAVASADTVSKDDLRAGKVTHQGIVTQKLDAIVPTMTSLSSPVARSVARESETNTDVIGSLVPAMKLPETEE